MKKILTVGLSLMCAALLAGQADAHGHHGGGGGYVDHCAPSYHSPVSWVTQKVTCYRPVWSAVEEKVQIQRVVCKTIVEKQKVAQHVTRWKDVPVTYTAYRAVPHQAWRDVTYCQMVPVTTYRTVSYCVPSCDPCCPPTWHTCQVPCVTYQPKYYTRKVQYTHYTTEAYPVETTVRQCYVDVVWSEVDVPRVITEYVPEWTTVTRHVCHMQPYTVDVQIPVCPPAPICPPVPCH